MYNTMSSDNEHIFSLYADGSSSGTSTGPGGWGWVLVYNKNIIDSNCGGSPCTTNNIMELMAALEGIRATIKNAVFVSKRTLKTQIELVSDSKYVLGMADGSYSPKKNILLAKELNKLCNDYDISVRWVRGHSGDHYNEMCDKMAKCGKEQFTPPKLPSKPKPQSMKPRKQRKAQSRKKDLNDI